MAVQMDDDSADWWVALSVASRVDLMDVLSAVLLAALMVGGKVVWLAVSMVAWKVA